MTFASVTVGAVRLVRSKPGPVTARAARATLSAPTSSIQAMLPPRCDFDDVDHRSITDDRCEPPVVALRIGVAVLHEADLAVRRQVEREHVPL